MSPPPGEHAREHTLTARFAVSGRNWRVRRSIMKVMYERCAGLDVHKKTVVACRLVSQEDGAGHMETRTFGTMTGDLLDLADWLHAGGVSHVAMESTGVYWKPV